MTREDRRFLPAPEKIASPSRENGLTDALRHQWNSRPPFAARAPGLWLGFRLGVRFGLRLGVRLGLRLGLAVEVERHCRPDESLQRRLVDFHALVDVDGAPDVPIEARIEET